MNMFSKRSDPQREDVHSMKQVFSKTSVPEVLGQVEIRYWNDSRTDAVQNVTPHTAEFIFFHFASQLRRNGCRQFTKLVEKQSSTLNLLDTIFPLTDNVCESTVFVAKELTFNQNLLKCGTVDSDAGLRTVLVQMMGHHFGRSRCQLRTQPPLVGWDYRRGQQNAATEPFDAENMLNDNVDGHGPKDVKRLFALDAQSITSGLNFVLGSSRTQLSGTSPYQMDITQAPIRAAELPPLAHTTG